LSQRIRQTFNASHTYAAELYTYAQNYTNLWHIAVAMAVHESSQLHHTPIPAIIGGGLAEHDLRYFGKDLTHALAACITMAASGREHGDVTDMHRWNMQLDKLGEQSRMGRLYKVGFLQLSTT
jgi:hypothetical protein